MKWLKRCIDYLTDGMYDRAYRITRDVFAEGKQLCSTISDITDYVLFSSKGLCGAYAYASSARPKIYTHLESLEEKLAALDALFIHRQSSSRPASPDMRTSNAVFPKLYYDAHFSTTAMKQSIVELYCDANYTLTDATMMFEKKYAVHIAPSTMRKYALATLREKGIVASKRKTVFNIYKSQFKKNNP